jgi:hypothetical protein
MLLYKIEVAADMHAGSDLNLDSRLLECRSRRQPCEK